MKKILSLSVMALLLMGLVGGGTWAYFSDTETASGSDLVAGTLDLGLSKTTEDDPAPTGGLSHGVSTPAYWAPGDDASVTIYLYNSGTIAMGEVTVKLVGDANVNNGTPASVSPIGTADTDNLLKMVKVKTATYGGNDVGSTLVGKTLEELTGTTPPEIVLGTLAAGGEAAFVITFEFNPTATNGCQGDSYGFDLTFTGYQKTGQNNP